MPWENIGDVDTGDSLDDAAWIEFCQTLAIRYLRFVCGSPPDGTKLTIMSHDHELGSYTSIGLWYEFDEPWDYYNKCERALNALNDAVNWSDLQEHYEDSFEVDEDEDEDEEEDGGDYQPEEAPCEPAETRDSHAAIGAELSTEDISDFSQVGAMMLIEAIEREGEYLPEDFHAEMQTEWGEIIEPYWERILDESLRKRNEWLNEVRKKRTGDTWFREYSWALSEDDLYEITEAEAEEQRDRLRLGEESEDARQALAANEQQQLNLFKRIRDNQRSIALDLARIVHGETVDELGFYSQVYRTLESKMPAQAPAQVIMSILASDNRIKKSELDWLDIETFLEENPLPSREQVLEFVSANKVKLEEIQLGGKDGTPPRFADKPFHLPGGENYREFILTMPGQLEPYQPDHIHFTSEGGGTAIVWARLDDRDGGATLHIAEIQSKRHQDGRVLGYRVNGESALGASASVPEAPYRNTNAWSMLMFKRLLHYAVEKGYERVTWDTGQTQAERYDLDESGRRGMEAFYDERLVNNINRLVRRWGTRVLTANSETAWTIDAGPSGRVAVHCLEISNLMAEQIIDQGLPLKSVLPPH